MNHLVCGCWTSPLSMCIPLSLSLSPFSLFFCPVRSLFRPPHPPLLCPLCFPFFSSWCCPSCLPFLFSILLQLHHLQHRNTLSLGSERYYSAVKRKSLLLHIYRAADGGEHEKESIITSPTQMMIRVSFYWAVCFQLCINLSCSLCQRKFSWQLTKQVNVSDGRPFLFSTWNMA